MTYLRKVAQDLLRLFRLSLEFIVGFHRFGRLGPLVTIFGSARIPSDSAYALMAERIGAECARMGFAVLTGGGPSVMEAANRGAKLAGGRTFGCNIRLPHEQRPNPYLDGVMTMRYFLTRKYMLTSYAYGFVVFPGGMGTLDEFFEIVTLMQTGKMPRRPIFLMGREYWGGMMEWLEGSALARGMIDRESLEIFRVTDDTNEVVRGLEWAKRHINEHGESHPVNREPKEAEAPQSAQKDPD